MVNYKTIIPLEMKLFHANDFTETPISATMKATSQIGGESIDDYVQGVKDFLSVYDLVLGETNTLSGILDTNSATHKKEFLIQPRGGRIVRIRRNPDADKRLSRQIDCVDGSRVDITFSFNGINYIVAYH